MNNVSIDFLRKLGYDLEIGLLYEFTLKSDHRDKFCGIFLKAFKEYTTSGIIFSELLVGKRQQIIILHIYNIRKL